MALPLDHSNEEFFEFDSSSEILEISALSYFSPHNDVDVDDEDVEVYSLEEGTVPVPCDLNIVLMSCYDDW